MLDRRAERLPGLLSVTSRQFRERTKRRAKRVDVHGRRPATALEEYVRLLARWNEKINSTALSVAEPDDEAIDRLLIEPLVAAKYLPARPLRLIDVGLGRSPAIPLLITVPGLSLTMVESKTRKAVFLTEVIRALGHKQSWRRAGTLKLTVEARSP